MSLESVLYDRLTTHAGLSALTVLRVYPLKMPQDVTLPAIVWQRISGERVGAMGADTGLVLARFQFTVWDDDFDGLIAVAEQLRLALARWSTSGPPVVQQVFFMAETDLFEAAKEREAEAYGRAADYLVAYEE